MLSPLQENSLIRANKKLAKSFDQTQKLIEELNQRELPHATQAVIQAAIDQVNSAPKEEKIYKKTLRKTYAQMLSQVRRDIGLVPKNHYMVLGMSLGMAVFGIPFGAAFGFALDNMGLMSIGLPIGLAIGLAIGVGLDAKAEKEGKQLSIAT